MVVGDEELEKMKGREKMHISLSFIIVVYLHSSHSFGPFTLIKFNRGF